MIWQKFFGIYTIDYWRQRSIIIMIFIFLTIQLWSENLLQRKNNSELWLPSMMWCAPHLLIWDAWSDRERNWKAKWVLPNLATFTGHFSSKLACRALARAEYQPQPQPTVPAVFARFQECPAFGDHCKLVSWPSGTPSPGIVPLTWCLSLPSLPQHPQYYQPSHNRTNWPGE